MKNKSYPYYDVPDLKNMQELVCYCGKTFGNKTAYSFFVNKKEVKKSYIEFFTDVAAVCNYFISKKYSRTHIALLGENSYEWLVFCFAIVNSNNIVVPLDKEMSIEQLNNIITESDSTVLIHSNEYTEEAEVNTQTELINMRSLTQIIEECKTDICTDVSFYNDVKIDDDAVCAIVYTSGTTSQPKGVMLSHRNIVSDTIATSKSVRVSDSSLLTLPLHHTYGFVASITIPMLIGSSIFINSANRYLIRDIKHSKPEYIAVVPLIAEVIYKKIWEKAKETKKDKLLNLLIFASDMLCKFNIDLRRKLFSNIIDELGGELKIMVIGGASIDSEYVKCFNSFGIKVLNGYGITECSPIVSTIRNEHYCPESVGTVHPGVEVRIVSGEIQVKGENVFKGYYKDIPATEKAFDGEWFRTGDLGELKDGFLYVTGRIKNLIILSNGKNVSPEELEYYFKSNIPEIKEIVVFSKHDTIVAEIYSDNDKADIIKETIFELNKNQPVYKQIKDIVFRNNEFEKTTTKKIKRNHMGENKNA